MIFHCNCEVVSLWWHKNLSTEAPASWNGTQVELSLAPNSLFPHHSNGIPYLVPVARQDTHTRVHDVGPSDIKHSFFQEPSTKYIASIFQVPLYNFLFWVVVLYCLYRCLVSLFGLRCMAFVSAFPAFPCTHLETWEWPTILIRNMALSRVRREILERANFDIEDLC